MARITRMIVPMIFVFLPLLVLGACSSDHSEAIKDVVNSFYSAWNDRDFEGCLELFSTNLGYSEEDLDNISAARENTGELTITDLAEPVVTGATATILAEVAPSEQESESIEIPLVKENGNWKLEGGGLSSRPAEEGDTVRVHYTLTLADGTEQESSRGGDPIVFTLGAGQMISGFENAVYGMEKGETKTVTIPPEEAYGPHDDSLVKIVHREDLPDTVSLAVGQQVVVSIDGIQRYTTITEITESTVTFDANDGLAGEYLTFEITSVGVVSLLAPGGAIP